MAENSKIEWCDHTFNPWEGCTKVSPGCAHCYAEARNARFGGGMAPNWGKGAPRRMTSEANWTQPTKWDNKAAGSLSGRSSVRIKAETQHGVKSSSAPLPHRPRVFCASLADWLDDEVPIEWLADLLDLIRCTPNLDWLLLTKRPENWRDRMIRAEYDQATHVLPGEERYQVNREWIRQWLAGRAPANVWIGTSVEDQVRADERIPLLLQIPARVRFLSCEPLLGALNLKPGLWKHMRLADVPGSALADGGYACREFLERRGEIHWVICGGESGPNARPMHPDWARSLRDQCAAAGVPFFFKQWGEWRPELFVEDEKPSDRGPLVRVGKLHAGRHLDGKEHSEFPEAHP